MIVITISCFFEELKIEDQYEKYFTNVPPLFVNQATMWKIYLKIILYPLVTDPHGI
jgi:hypothetical protein